VIVRVRRPTFLFAPEQATTPQLGNNLVDEDFEAFGRAWEHDNEFLAILIEKAIARFRQR
jgi:hypothetical protein